MAGIAPGLDGYIAAQQLGQQRQAQELGMLSKILQMKQMQDEAAASAEMRPLQMGLLRSKIDENNAQIPVRQAALAAAQRQEGALAKLAALQSGDPSMWGGTRPTAVMGNEAAAREAAIAADARGERVDIGVPNQTTMNSLLMQADPKAYVTEATKAAFPKPVAPTTPRQNIVPVTGGYLQPNASGQMEFVRTQQAGEGRAEPAPVVKDIIDPSDPKRLISIDVRKYRGGSLGADGVIGVAGREPTSQKKSEQLDVGRQEIDRDVITLKSALDELKAGGGITSTSKGVPSNVMAYVANTGVGQTLGQMGGTENQKARDVISQARPLLLRSIMQATGMSAKNLDSNAELKLWLATATDPTKGYEANIEALNNIAEKYGTGGFIPTEKSKPIGGAVTPTPAPSTGIRFLGFENGPSR